MSSTEKHHDSITINIPDYLDHLGWYETMTTEVAIILETDYHIEEYNMVYTLPFEEPPILIATGYSSKIAQEVEFLAQGVFVIMDEEERKRLGLEPLSQ